MMGLAGEAAPTDAPMVRAALKAVRRRRGALQRQAAPLRLGKALDSHVTKGFTLAALLDACGGDLQGLRDAALLSLGYDAGLRVRELKTGRASCRDRVCQYVEISGVAVSLKKQKKKILYPTKQITRKTI